MSNNLIGYKGNMAAFVSDEVLATHSVNECKRKLGMEHRYPVKTDLSGNVVMVEADSHQDAVQRWLRAGGVQ